MDVKRFNEIKGLIAQAEIQSAKAKGVIESIESEWEKEFGTSDVQEIESILEEKRAEYKKAQERLNDLYDKLLESYDWERLEEDLR
jgi:uncharacterized coiled-coil protein SlyX